ncbi:hypothetical protein EVAR_21292_1 [Eumeta japonica]|uniref:Helitron helicase-like domain-containing protein n=1 Tax=Eumeta variegata TaxID=151549 RepID=A0A4C1WLL2_EUMVA|nr:hypothetical protein EVAR_21292_1 [Eumeta japonica]
MPEEYIQQEMKNRQRHVRLASIRLGIDIELRERERESSVERELRRSRDRDRHRIQRARKSSARVTNSWVKKEKSAMNYDLSISYKDDRIVSIGTMSVLCEHCLALKFKDESKGMCCLQGKVKLEEILPPSEPFHSLLTGDHQKSKQFMRNIRRYNNAFQMTSFKSKQVVERGFMPTFKIQRQVYHLAGILLPLRPDDHKFLQIYFIADPDTQASTRCSSVAQPIDRDLIRSLQDMSHSHNCYIQSFKTAIESVPADTPDFNVVIHANKFLLENTEDYTMSLPRVK